MRIGIEATLLLKERSGVGQYLRHLVEGLGSIDQDNKYVLFYNYHSLKPGVRSLPTFPWKNVSLKPLPWPRAILYALTGLGRWHLPGLMSELGSPDVLHWPNGIALETGTAKQIITIHDLTDLLYPECHAWLRARVRAHGVPVSASRADMIIVPSEHTKKDVMRVLAIPEQKVRVIYDAAAAWFRPVGDAEKLPVLTRYRLRDASYLLYVGNIEPRKNLVRLLEAYAVLLRMRTCPYPLIFIGGRGWRNQEIFSAVTKLDLEKKVRFLGYVPDDDMAPLMSGACVFVYPSLYEGFGIPPLEAMACGTPVITSNTSALPEVVGDAAIMIDPYDVEGLVRALWRVVSDARLREEMRSKGLERAKLFSWHETAWQTLRAYEEVCAKS